MEQTGVIGTGESLVNVSKFECLRLENTSISPEEALAFLQWQSISCKVDFLPEKKYRWGTAYSDRRYIKLYRHSVWTFLHEVAHILSPGDHHNFTFAAALQGLYLKWKELES